MKVRAPHVAGHFYPGDRETLVEFLRNLLDGPRGTLEAKGVFVPHAGYIYSGRIAGRTFSRVALPSTAIILGPNHTGYGKPLALMPEGIWQTPLGKIAIEGALAEKLLTGTPLEKDDEAHRYEHSVEVEIPFLQYLKPDIQFVPVILGTQHTPLLAETGSALARIVAAWPEPVLIVASGDLNHYENEPITRVKDEAAIQAMLELDENKLAREVREKGISMCGFAPAYVTIVALKALGARSACLIEHTTSAEASGDYDRVVGYAGICFL